MTQSYAGFSVFYGWLSNTFPSPPAKRAVALAFINSVSQLGNIVGSYVVVTHYSTLPAHSALVQLRLAAYVGADIQKFLPNLSRSILRLYSCVLRLEDSVILYERQGSESGERERRCKTWV